MQRKIIVILPVIIVCAAAVMLTFIFMNTTGFASSTSSSSRVMSIEDYVANNISELSPVKEQVGGKFHVTHIYANAGTGAVDYEDGHNAYTADFTYEVSETAGITVRSFNVRE